ELTRKLPLKDSKLLIEKISLKSKQLGDIKSQVIINYVKHLQIFGLLKRNGEILELANEINTLSEKIDYKEGKALYYIIMWGVEKLQGNIKRAIVMRKTSMEIIDSLENPDIMVSNWIKYSYAVGEWTEERNLSSAKMLEDCMIFFRKREHYSSEINAATFLANIYSKTNQKDELFNIVQEIMGNDILFQYYPKYVLGRFHHLLGLMFLSRGDKELAEMHLFSSTQLFKRFSHTSNYIYDYLSGLSILARIYATSGKLDRVHDILTELKEIVDEGDLYQKLSKQFVNSLVSSITITQFYMSFHRRNNYNLDFRGEVRNLLLRYQNFILLPEMLTELMVYSGIEIEELSNLKKEKLPNNFLKRVIDFLLALQNPDVSSTEERIKNASIILDISPGNTVKEEFGRIFGDMILSKLYLSSGRYEKFKSTMKKYIFKTDKITNISLRIMAESMEAIYKFLQSDKAEKAIERLSEIISECEEKNLTRMGDEVKAFRQMLIQKNMNFYHKQIFSDLSYQDLISIIVENR
ncbi:MAG: hypothetical protein KAX32_00700, partial [Candidatus Heimdallarchaeota archaeon]|nr:hypothetical protein [Candidatus Heimdallarchaeota archaeon]